MEEGEKVNFMLELCVQTKPGARAEERRKWWASYPHRYIASLERNGKLETLEAINEKIWNRFKNPKLSNSNCAKLSMETKLQPVLNGVEILNLGIPRKLLLWPYALLHGRYANISMVLKHYEENIKSKMKKGVATLSTSLSTILSTTTTFHTGSVKDGANHGGGNETWTVLVTASMTSVPLFENA
ncbi:hypothetical protein GH714_002354 [Hevea brasiliensis]|uniref:Uncharacterized protein n=1 Tax=Hevea brasiliensis TaxID=3981 RepID=A0A6A6LHA1_HEVBR|nr:hypothetical protein GH714_002354 [Hevea brasiliensis]